MLAIPLVWHAGTIRQFGMVSGMSCVLYALYMRTDQLYSAYNRPSIDQCWSMKHWWYTAHAAVDGIHECTLCVMQLASC